MGETSAVHTILDVPALRAAVLAVRAATDSGRLEVALIPARNEEGRIEAEVVTLRRQTPPPSLIVVVADDCTDATARVAEASGAVVFETVGNGCGRAGALSQALEALLPVLEPDDALVVADAGSAHRERFPVETLRRLHSRG